MIATALDNNTIEISVYDWVWMRDDYVCGHLKIDRDACDSDLANWMFYPAGGCAINVRDLIDIAELAKKLNKSKRG
jgi:hypothetical protein